MKLAMLILLAVSGCASTAPAHALSFPDRNRAAVVDAAHVLSTTEREALDRKVVAWDKATGRQFVVATVPNLQGVDIKTYGYQLGRAWALGDKQRNDGAILLLAIAERKVRIEVGYGLEPVLTDAITSVIIRDRVVPRLREGNPAQALSDGADAIMQVATATDASPSPPTVLKHHGAPLWAALLPILAIFAGLIGWVTFWFLRERRAAQDEMERHSRELERRQREIAERGEDTRRRIEAGIRPYGRRFDLHATPAPAPTVVIAETPPPTYSEPSRSSGYGSDDNSGSTSSSFGDFGGSDSGSSSGFDSGGGSFGGGGSDSSW